MKIKYSLLISLFFLTTLSCSARATGEVVPTAAETARENLLREMLTIEQYGVTQLCSTEPAFNNAYWDNKEAGIYVDIVSGIPLFSSEDKFDSGTGWPSFTRPISDSVITEIPDKSFGIERVEVKGSDSLSHLGHVFTDGPGPEGLRYCINSASLRFIARKDLEKEGYGLYLSTANRQSAIFAAGCFWGTEGYFRQLEGVLSTEVGYSGGITKNPGYREVLSGTTGHAESIRIDFDPAKISYQDLVRHFFRMHNPTTLNRQGNDIGSQYRSAIFTLSDRQTAEARLIMEETQNSLGADRPIVTEIRQAGAFYAAEEYHQDYLEKNPDGYCHVDLGLAAQPLSIPNKLIRSQFP